MSRRTLWGAGAIAVTLLLGAAAVLLAPVDRAGYRAAAGTAAQDSLSAVRTLARVARADLAGRLTPQYVRVVAATTREAAAAPPRDLAAEELPDAAARGLRDRVLPLLTTAAGVVGDAGLALGRGDRAAIGAAVAELDRVGDDLAAVVEELR